ncbi:unannotated protein [freshwater metagenome]|uniref:Unannotated protein n=1 Tax=freshwater metagenome TaxID=449393 RepID=A0A6J7TID0_9ZZZZ
MESNPLTPPTAAPTTIAGDKTCSKIFIRADRPTTSAGPNSRAAKVMANAAKSAKYRVSINSDATTVASNPRPTAVATGRLRPALP